MLSCICDQTFCYSGKDKETSISIEILPCSEHSLALIPNLKHLLSYQVYTQVIYINIQHFAFPSGNGLLRAVPGAAPCLPSLVYVYKMKLLNNANAFSIII